MKLILRSALTLAIVILATPASAALSSYLTLVGEAQGAIEGRSTQAGREGQIVVRAFDLSAGTMTITSEVSQATPQLLTAQARNEVMRTFNLFLYRPNRAGQEENYANITLVGAQVTAVVVRQLDNQEPSLQQFRHQQTVTFSFRNFVFRENGSGVEGP